MYRPIREAAPAAPDELTAFVIDAMDNVLETVLSADIEGPRWVLKVEDHTKNLPPDPEQASSPIAWTAMSRRDVHGNCHRGEEGNFERPISNGHCH